MTPASQRVEISAGPQFSSTGRTHLKPPAGRERVSILVLGTHRSGTSALAGTLGRLGAVMPRTLMPATADNSRGYWESLPIVRFNDRLLYSGGSGWWDWTQFNPNWAQ